MKSLQNKQSRIKVAILSIVGLVVITLIAGTSVYALSGSLFGWNPFSPKTESTLGDNPASSEQIKAGDSIKENSVNNSGSSGSDQPVMPAPQTDGRQLVQLDITNVNKIEASTHIGVLISVIDSGGTCTLKVLSQAGVVVYTASVGVQPMSNTSTCRGFDIPNQSIPAKYKLVVDFTSGTKYGTASYDSP